MNINIKLDKNFTAIFNKLVEEGGEEMAKLNGVSSDHLSYTDFIDHFVDNKVVADASIDSNSNVKSKDICTLLNEMSKPHMKVLAFNKIFYELNKKYGYKAACAWLEGEWRGDFYLHDAPSSTTLSYCYSYDIEGLVKRGLFFIPDFNAQPPKHLTTFTDFVGEFVSWTSNRTSGACGLASFLIYSYYFWKRDIEENYFVKSPEYYRDQEFQRIIFKLNQPYLRVTQTAFTNFSIFDRDYLIELFGSKEFPDGTFIIDYTEDILEYQKAFMKVVSDIRSQNMMTFPVLTFALLRKDGKFADEDFAKWCCKHNMQWADSNFFISKDITSLSNCCITGDTVISVKNKITGTTEIFKIEDFVSLFNSGDKEFIEEVNTNYEIKSYDYDKNVWVYEDITGLIRKNNNYDFLLEFSIEDRTISVTPDHELEVVNIETNDHLKLSALLVSLNIDKYLILLETMSKFVPITSVKKVKNNDNFVYCIDVNRTHNFNANGVNIGNCRLISDVKALGKNNDNSKPYFNSIGGSALEVGSIKVNTINLARVAYDSCGNEEEYLNVLSERVLNCCRTLDVVRRIIVRNVEKGLLPNYSLNVIDIKSQYNTIGIIGIYETLDKFGYTYKDEFGYTYYKNEGLDFAKRILAKIAEVKDVFIKEQGCEYMINIEQVPAERAAYILMEKDKHFYPNEKYELPLYANQWIPLAVKCTLNEKIRLSAVLDKACNGGSIAHINLDAPLTEFDSAWSLLNHVADAGVVYFAFCLRISACRNNHGFYGDECPVCGEPKTTSYQRIVGFLTAETTYSKERKAEFRKRDWIEADRLSDI